MLTHFKNLCFLATFLVFSVLAVSSAFAQTNEPPSGQFGLGVYAISSSLPSGIEGTYALDQHLQIGSGMSLGVLSSGGRSSTLFSLNPFVRYQFQSKVSPFVQGGFEVLAGNGGANFGIFLGGGVAYYINHSVGVNAGIDLINILFSPSVTAFGWSIVRVGADWFF